MDDWGTEGKASEQLLRRKTRRASGVCLARGFRLSPLRVALFGPRAPPALRTSRKCLKHLRQQLRLKSWRQDGRMRAYVVHAARFEPELIGRACATSVICAAVAAIVWSQKPQKSSQWLRRYVKTQVLVTSPKNIETARGGKVSAAAKGALGDRLRVYAHITSTVASSASLL